MWLYMKKSHIIIFLLVTLILAGCVYASNDTNDFKVSANKNTVKMGDTITFKATKNVNDSSPVVFKVNDKTIINSNNVSKVKPVNNKASVKYKVPDGTRSGKVKVTAVTTINKSRVETNTYYNVEKMGTKITNVNVYRNLDTINITATIKDEHNHKLKGSTKISVKVNGKTLTKGNKALYFKSNNGVFNASFKLSNNVLNKKVSLTLISSTTGAYKSSKYTINNLQKTAKEITRTKINFKDITLARNRNELTINAKIVDLKNKSISDADKISVKINGNTYKENNQTKYYYPNSNGVLTVKIKVYKSLSTKTFNITLISGDTYKYYSKKQNIVTAYTNVTRINVNREVNVNYTDIKIPLKVLADDQKAVTDGNIKVYVNNKFYSDIKCNQSTSYIRLNNLTCGKYTVKLVYSSSNYNGSSNTVQLSVSRIYKTRKTMVAATFVKCYSKINEDDLKKWLDAGITDVFVQAKQIENETTNLRYVIDLCKNTNIKVHAWIIVFRETTKWDYSVAQQNRIKNFISQVIQIDGVEGVSLDYVRYSGANPSTVNVSMITNFVKDVHNILKNYDKHLELSASVFAEGSATKTYYGQDYVQLSKHLEFIMPMEYRYTYHKGTEWMTEITKYVKDRSSYAKVVPVIAAAKDYDAKNKLTADELRKDIQALLAGGAYGYVLFQHKTVLEYPKIF